MRSAWCPSLFSCCNKMHQTRWFRSDRSCSVTEAGSPQSGCQPGHVRTLVWVTALLLCPHMAERELKYESTNPAPEGTTLMIQSPPKGPTS